MENIVEKEIDGVLYKARFKGIAYSIELDERMESGQSFSIAETLFDEVLVSPKIGIDDFEDVRSYSKVFAFLLTVAYGEYEIKSKARLKEKAEENWALWRLIFSNRGFDYQTVFGKPYMSPRDVAEANIALDMYLEAEKNAVNSK